MLIQYNHVQNQELTDQFYYFWDYPCYVSMNMPRSFRSAFSKFRSGTAPLHLETGRYITVNVSERVCFHCCESVEDESHVLLHCPLYAFLRESLYENVCLSYPNFLVIIFVIMTN